MNITLIPPRSRNDYADIATLHNLIIAEPVTMDELYTTEQESTDQQRRMIALNQHDQIVGTSIIRALTSLPGTYYANVSIAVTARQQGLGRKLYADLESIARNEGANEIYSSFSDQEAAPRAFAEACGFIIEQHWVYFALDLVTFDHARFAPTKADVKAQGIRFFSLAEAGTTPENQQKLYILNRNTSLDAPGEDSFPSLEEFIQDICLAPWFRPEGQIIAADGEDWIGLGAVSLHGDIAHNAFTGVEKRYRRRHIAEALTLHTIEYAQHHGAKQLQVFNDSRNVGMLAMQTKLGYQPLPGRYVMTKRL